MTAFAGFFDLFSRATAGGAGLLHAKESLLHPNRAMTMAGGAGDDLGAFGSTAAIAGFAIHQSRYGDFDLGAGNGLFEGDFKIVAKV